MEILNFYKAHNNIQFQEVRFNQCFEKSKRVSFELKYSLQIGGEALLQLFSCLCHAHVRIFIKVTPILYSFCNLFTYVYMTYCQEMVP